MIKEKSIEFVEKFRDFFSFKIQSQVLGETASQGSATWALTFGLVFLVLIFSVWSGSDLYHGHFSSIQRTRFSFNLSCLTLFRFALCFSGLISPTLFFDSRQLLGWKVSSFFDHNYSRTPNRNMSIATNWRREAKMSVNVYVFSQVTEHGWETYSFDPWNKERREGKGESSSERQQEGKRQRDRKREREW